MRQVLAAFPLSRPRQFTFTRLLCGAMCLGASACSTSETSTPSGVSTQARPGEKIVARVNGVPIWEGDVKLHAASTGLSKKDSLDAIVDFELLFQASAASDGAEESGEPAILAVKKSMLIQRLIETQFEATHRPEDIPETELRKLYERAKSAYVHPRLVEVEMLVVYTGARMRDEPRAERRAIASRVAAFIASTEGQNMSFEDIRQKEALHDGKLGYKTVWQGPDKPFPEAIGTAALALRRPGETSAMVEDDTGYYILRYIGERAPKNRTFDQVADEIRKEYHPVWKQQSFARYVDGLAEGYAIQVAAQGW